MATRADVRFDQPRDYHDEIVAPTDDVRLDVIPGRRHLMIDGDEPPGSAGFQQAVGSLYPIAYGVHFALEAAGCRGPVGVLEGRFREGESGPVKTIIRQPVA